MSTRSTINFHYGNISNPIEAKVYKHHDGYPSERWPLLQKFLDAIQAESPDDTRFNDPSYLAARFIVWHQMQPNYRGVAPGFTGTGIGVCQEDPCDIDYTWHVVCGDRDKRPEVFWRTARHMHSTDTWSYGEYQQGDGNSEEEDEGSPDSG